MVVKQKFLCFLASLCVYTGLKAQQSVEASGITFQYEVKGDSIHAVLSAPTEGWVGVGFNSKNSIVGSDLLLFNIRSKKVTGTDLFVKSAGNPVQDSGNGGKNTAVIHGGTQESGYTKIQFSIPLDSNDPNDFVHVLGQKYWLILAYSVSDDFDHHSRVRKHIPFVLEK
ncbi:MAG: DOMON domain-containing protein, partial [Bacteroidota bacterium]